MANRTENAILTIAIYFFIVVLVGCSQKSSVYRMVRYGDSDIDDFKKFPSRTIDAANTIVPFVSDTISGADKFNGIRARAAFDKLLEERNTISFIVIHNDTIVYEKHDEKYNKAEAIQYFSITKSIMSLMIGCTIDDRLISSENDLVTKYIPELHERGFKNITLLDLMQMQAPVNYSEDDNPFGVHPKFYYTSQLEENILQLTADEKDQKSFVYRSGNIAILGLVLKRALKNETISEYFRRRIWSPIGAEDKAFWTIDNIDSSGIEKTWCCLAGTSRDLAKIAEVYLHRGMWNGRQIVSEEWINKTFLPLINTKEEIIYNYGWWIYPKKQAAAAIGKDGQFMYIVPSKNLIMIRLGKNMGGVTREGWLHIFESIVTAL